MTGKSVGRIRIGREKTLPFEPLAPNRKTATAMREARGRKPFGFDGERRVGRTRQSREVAGLASVFERT